MSWAIPRVLTAAPLTPEAFRPFGQVLMPASEASHRSEFAARLENYRINATLNMAFIRAIATREPLVVRTLERHAFSAQSFVPVEGTRYLVVVCPAAPGGEPDAERGAAFAAQGDQAVNYAAGVWHAPHAVLDGPGTFIMLRWDVGNDQDTELIEVVPPLAIALPLAPRI